MNYGFFALMFRMKHIDRWALMRCNAKENLAEHSLEVAIIANALANIGNTYFNKNYSSDRIALKALFHDATEIMTGDLPTPIKYYNSDIRNAYATVEKCAQDKVLSLLPQELIEKYEDAFILDEDEKILIKAADKLCAYIKCANEVRSGNIEFSHAAKTTKSAIEAFDCQELKYFCKHFLEAFFEPLDNISL
ncbi:MAG: 5'-deoxynucleotidase [Ruminococcaceae bacterium]|nr:5'-deoxynucleotidase [Oscillospiraceae bacterium]